MKTKLSELGPCQCCGKPLEVVFYEITIATCVVKVDAVRQVSGLAVMLGSLGLAEAMAPVDDVVATSAELDLRLRVCQACAWNPDCSLGHLVAACEK